MLDLIGVVVAVGVPVVGFITWLVRLEGRHNVLDAKHVGLERRVDSLEQRILDQLDRIEQKLDRKADK